MKWYDLFAEGTFICGDCLPYMKEMPNKIADLAIIDPPYGIDVNKMNLGEKRWCKSGEKWDTKPPSTEYFKELRRISRNQIIWGANHFISKMPYDASCWIVWDKLNGDTDFADCELAWTSFDSPVRKFEFNLSQQSKIEIKFRFHPTQKPIALYKWILSKFAKPNMRIIDTHVGSASSLIAFLDFGCRWVGFERDKYYYDLANNRIVIHKKQIKIPLHEQGRINHI
jgi:site-specific DNA-methyltransferase (adenine-specific)